MPNILVTGGAGFIGSYLVNSLTKNKKNKIFILDRITKSSSVPFISKKSILIKKDITNPKTFIFLKKFKFDICFHLAAQSSSEPAYDNPKDDILTNSYGTYLVCKFCSDVKIKRFIYTSSVAVYGNSRLKSSENSIPCPDSIYGSSKLSGEHFVHQFFRGSDTNYTIFRLSNIYGPGENLYNLKKGMMSIFIGYLWSNKTIIVKGNKNRERNFTYIVDLVNILIKSIPLKKTNNQTINICSSEKINVEKLLHIIIKIFSSKKTIIKYKYSSTNTPGDSFHLVMNSKKLSKLTNYNFKYNLEKGLNNYKKWLTNVKYGSNLNKYHPLNEKE